MALPEDFSSDETNRWSQEWLRCGRQIVASVTKTAFQDGRWIANVNRHDDRIATHPYAYFRIREIAMRSVELQPAIKARPSKANHVLRYLRRTFGWGIRHGPCAHKPAKGVRQVKEKADHRMPSRRCSLLCWRSLRSVAGGKRTPWAACPRIWLP